jgi:hypothetical protein
MLGLGGEVPLGVLISRSPREPNLRFLSLEPFLPFNIGTFASSSLIRLRFFKIGFVL